MCRIHNGSVLSALLAGLMVLTTCLSPGFAGPGSGELILFSQPDGSIFRARIMGDEFSNWAETASGYAVVKNPISQYWEYAVKGMDGQLIGSGIILNQAAMALPDYIVPGVRPEPRMMSIPSHGELGLEFAPWVPTPVSGERNILIVLVSFANRSLTTTSGAWNNSLFASSGKTVAKFFIDNSFGTFGIVPVSHTQSGPVGVISVTLTTNHPNYGGTLSFSTDQAMGNAALAQAASFINFNSYDTSGDGILQSNELCIYFIIAGYEASGTAKTPNVWAHAWSTTGTGLTAGAKNVQRWGLNGELNNSSAQHPMGVIAHEMGHQICGLPDLYDTNNTNAGLGYFSLMAGGNWGADIGEESGTTPVSMDAWSREYLGWAAPLASASGDVTLNPALQSKNSAIKLIKSTFSTTEYFLLENRYPTGWDLGIRGKTGFGSSWQGGLLILHVDNAIGSNKYVANSHQGVIAEQASTSACNMLTTSCRGDKTTLFYSGNNNNWGISTTPSSSFYSGTASSFSVSGISAPASGMTMTIGTGGGGIPSAAILVSPSGSISTTTPTYVWNAVSTATHYHLWVDDSSGHRIDTWYSSGDAGCTSGIGTCSVTPAIVLAAGSAQWWIETWNSCGYGPWSSGMSFTITSPGPPPAATLASPAGAISTTTPSYVWNAVSTATYYYLWVDDSSGHRIDTWYTSAEAGCASGTGTCSVTPSTVLAAGTAQWWIQTWNSHGYGPWSSGMSFAVASPGPPPAATLVSPAGAISTTTPSYVWNAVSTATYYYLWVDDSSGHRIETWHSSAEAGCASGTGTCSVTPSTVLAAGNAQWWIETWNSYGYGPWSSGMSFTVPSPGPPPAATLVSPSGAISTTTPTYVWKAVSTATQYYLWVDDSSGNKVKTWYTAALAGCASGTCSVTPSTVLAAGNAQWWIQTSNSYGYGPWSNGMTFTVPSPGGGFNSQFNGNSDNWHYQSVAPPWLVSSNYLYTLGAYNVFASVYYGSVGDSTSIFGDFDYQAAVRRDGCDTCTSGIMLRGFPTPLGSGYRWDSGYYFLYSPVGTFALFKYIGGVPTALISTHTHSAINTYSAWNTLRAVASGGTIIFLY